MKKTSILALMLAITAVLPACGNTSVSESSATETTVNLVDKYTATEPNEDIALPEGFVIPEGYTYEKAYQYSPLGDNNKGIDFQTSTMELFNDRLYYSSAKGLTYIDVKTGQTLTMCPDPLCAHTAESGCEFLGIRLKLHNPENENILFVLQEYLTGTQVHSNICVVDEKNGTIKKVYGTDVDGSELLSAIFFGFISDEKLYFIGRTIDTEEGESAKIVTEPIDRIFTMNINTYEVKQLDNKYGSGNNGTILIASKTHILFCDYANGKVKVTDHNFENEKILLEYDPRIFTLIEYCYDSVTDEIYFSVVSKLLMGEVLDSNDEHAEHGYVYRVDNVLNCEKLDISDKIINFAITRNYIYFTQYEPVELGKTMIGTRCVIVNGGKFYRIKRDGTEAVERVINCGKELINYIGSPFIVLGDYIYYQWAYVNRQKEHVTLKLEGRVRIGITDKTVKSLSLN